MENSFDSKSREQKNLERMKVFEEVWSGIGISDETDLVSPEGKKEAKTPLPESSGVVVEESSAQMNEVSDSVEKPEDAPVQDVAGKTNKREKKVSHKPSKKQALSDKNKHEDSTCGLSVYFSSFEMQKLKIISMYEGRTMCSLVKDVALEYLTDEYYDKVLKGMLSRK